MLKVKSKERDQKDTKYQQHTRTFCWRRGRSIVPTLRWSAGLRLECNESWTTGMSAFGKLFHWGLTSTRQITTESWCSSHNNYQRNNQSANQLLTSNRVESMCHDRFLERCCIHIQDLIETNWMSKALSDVMLTMMMFHRCHGWMRHKCSVHYRPLSSNILATVWARVGFDGGVYLILYISLGNP